jgi:hypothetical protein
MLTRVDSFIVVFAIGDYTFVISFKRSGWDVFVREIASMRHTSQACQLCKDIGLKQTCGFSYLDTWAITFGRIISSQVWRVVLLVTSSNERFTAVLGSSYSFPVRIKLNDVRRVRLLIVVFESVLAADPGLSLLADTRLLLLLSRVVNGGIETMVDFKILPNWYGAVVGKICLTLHVSFKTVASRVECVHCMRDGIHHSRHGSCHNCKSECGDLMFLCEFELVPARSVLITNIWTQHRFDCYHCSFHFVLTISPT